MGVRHIIAAGRPFSGDLAYTGHWIFLCAEVLGREILPILGCQAKLNIKKPKENHVIRPKSANDVQF